MADPEKKNLPAHKPIQSEVHTDRHKVAQKALEAKEASFSDPACSDPDCGYRKLVEAQREKSRARLAKHRKKP